MGQTDQQFKSIIKICKEVFTKKMHDYGTAWRILRSSSITDQIYIKAQRIRSIETKGLSKIREGIFPEFIGIVNYAVIGLIQLELGPSEESLDEDKILVLYQKYLDQAKSLMEKKNHDYDEAWRNMHVSSFTDLILMKIHRMKQMEKLEGKTLVSEGLDANYFDIINYAIFGLIKLKFEKEN